jgi:putative hydrolase of the HAD superfamily
VIRHVLLDADGVVQRGAGPFLETLQRHLGEDAVDFLTRTFPEDGPVIRGEAEVAPLLATALLERGSDADAYQLFTEVWLAIEVLPESLAVARALRASGVGVHLATNQDSGRAAYMKSALGYDEVFDTCFYSCDLGRAKPSAGFFDRVVEALGTDPGAVLFVDDSQANVDGARAAGLLAERWESGDGMPALQALLGKHELRLSE